MADIKESLLSLGIEQSVVDQVMAKVGDKKLHVFADGEGIPMTRFTEVNEQKNAFKKQVEELNSQVAELSKFKGTADEWKQKAETIQAEHTAKIAEMEKGFTTKRIELEINTALTLSKAKNNKAVSALLDTQSIKLDGDKVVGLNEQLEKVMKDNPYLFDTVQPNTPPSNIGRNNPIPPTGNPNEEALARAFGIPIPK